MYEEVHWQIADIVLEKVQSVAFVIDDYLHQFIFSLKINSSFLRFSELFFNV